MRKLPLFSVLLFLCLALTILLVEDLLWLNAISLQSQSMFYVRLGRFFIAVSLAMLIGVFFYPIAHQQQYSMAILKYLIENSFAALSQKEVKQYHANTELGQLIYRLKEKMLQEKAVLDSYLRNLWTYQQNSQIIEKKYQKIHPVAGYTIHEYQWQQNTRHLAVYQLADGLLYLQIGRQTTVTQNNEIYSFMQYCQIFCSRLTGFTTLKGITRFFMQMDDEIPPFQLFFLAEKNHELWYLCYPTAKLYSYQKQRITALQAIPQPEFLTEEERFFQKPLAPDEYILSAELSMEELEKINKPQDGQESIDPVDAYLKSIIPQEKLNVLIKPKPKGKQS